MCSLVWARFSQDSPGSSQLVQRLVLNECDSCSIRLNVILAKMLLVPNRSVVKQIQDNGGPGDSSSLQDPRGLPRLPVRRKQSVCFTQMPVS